MCHIHSPYVHKPCAHLETMPNSLTTSQMVFMSLCTISNSNCLGSMHSRMINFSHCKTKLIGIIVGRFVSALCSCWCLLSLVSVLFLYYAILWIGLKSWITHKLDAVDIPLCVFFPTLPHPEPVLTEYWFCFDTISKFCDFASKKTRKMYIWNISEDELLIHFE